MRGAAAVLLVVLAGCDQSNTPASAYLPSAADGDAPVEGGLTPGEMRFKQGVCDGEVLTPEFQPLTEDDLVAHLEKHGYKTRKVKARRDLVYIDIVSLSEVVRLRVAILPSPAAAGRELHDALLEHGPGSWGAHRSNLAVLAPIASPGHAAGFAAKSKLACWGVFTIAGLDDTFVVPGAYMEL